MNTNNIKADLLGAVTHTPNGAHVVDMSILKTPLEKSDSVIQGFCTTCGNYSEYNEDAFNLVTGGDYSVKADASKSYFSTNRCRCCYDIDSKIDVKVELLPIF